MKRILLVILALSITGLCYAAGTQEIALTTYYPAPYGDYDNLQAKEFYMDAQGHLNTNRYGVINLAGRTVDPNAANSREGDIYWHSTDDTFRYYDGSSWRALDLVNPVFDTVTAKQIKMPGSFTSTINPTPEEVNIELQIYQPAGSGSFVFDITDDQGMGSVGADLHFKKNGESRISLIDSYTDVWKFNSR